ncbi:Hsp20/alpha crystallin family protein [Paenibacillus sp. BSR1-1]|uniref:Hsp20/alpha crystallin family protein n=1 Tax=Paenibacillus sp. BSR1-1 TaxID=3020845 RepID=UPI0025B26A05|nr:Hsp20/alpha crystallin family protein [Paenibacillus sp. BSR1-1]MDN3019367.1 Hsp20/alpha crystallin family protein [Paenibacillus sp. BSR1-1]
MFPWNMFPFNKNMKDSMKNMKPEEIENFVQDLMRKIMPQNMMGMMNPQDLMNGFQSSVSQQPQMTGVLNSAAFETHDFVFVRIPLKSDEWLKQIRIYHTSNKLIVEHIPEQEDKHTITLPAIVRKKGAAANYKDGVLEIKIPKNIDMQYSQIDVTEIL